MQHTAALAEETQGHSFGYSSDRCEYTGYFLDELLANQKSSISKKELDDGYIAWIKLKPKDTSIQVTQWNSDCVRSTLIRRTSDGEWKRIQDRAPMTEYHQLEDYYVHPQGLRAEITDLENQRICTLSQSERQSLLQGSEKVRHADQTMWRYII